MKNLIGNRREAGAGNCLTTRGRLLLAAMALSVGAHCSKGALAIYSPRGAEVFGKTQLVEYFPPKNIRVQWDFPVDLETPDMVFKIYHSTNLTIPAPQWLLLTNLAGALRTVDFPADKPEEFFSLTVSNYLGETDLGSFQTKKVRVFWEYPAVLETPDMVFKIYHSPDITLPFQEWALLQNIPGNLRSTELPALSSQDYFIMTCSNYTGESTLAAQ